MVRLRKGLMLFVVAVVLGLSTAAAFADDNGGGPETDHETGDLNAVN